jgi:uncharacterized membrane protein
MTAPITETRLMPSIKRVRSIIGRLFGLGPGEFLETWDTILLVPIGFGVLVISSVLTVWPISNREIRNLAVLVVLILLLFALVRDKRSAVVGALLFLALKWIIAAVILSHVFSALIGSALVILAVLIARRKPTLSP